ncbi:hypothetical protein JCM14469_37280 [Desulfatiferula olefinivorans]
MVELSFVTDPTDNQKRQILALYHRRGWWPKTVNDPERISRIIRGSHCFLLAMEGDEVAGMGRALSDRTGDAYIHDLTVRQAFRNRGLGRRLVRMIIDRLVSDGITWVGLIAEGRSHGFYEKDGFQIMEDARPMYRWVP